MTKIAMSIVATLAITYVIALLERQGVPCCRRIRRPPWFNGRGTKYLLGGEPFWIYEYRTAAEAQADASRIAKDGYAIGTFQIEWVAPPHFYRTGRLIVQYLGSNARILDSLGRVRGPQIAGTWEPPNNALDPTAAGRQ